MLYEAVQTRLQDYILKAAGSNLALAIYHVYATCDFDTFVMGVYFCHIGFDKALDALVIEVLSVFL